MNTDEPMVAAAPESGTTEAPQTTQAAVPASEETPVESTQTESQGQPKEDSFFDPSSLSEELVPAYKQMQAAFTKKTQEIAEQRKQFQEIQQQNERYKQYEQYMPILEEMSKAQATPQASPEMAALEQELRGRGFSDEAIEMMKVGAEFTLRQFNQTLQSKDQQQQAEQQAKQWTSQVEQVQALDQRLTDTSLTYQASNGTTRTFGQIVEGIVLATPNYQKNLVGVTKEAIAIVDAMLGQAKTQGKEELSASAQAKARKFPNTSPSSVDAVDESKPLSFNEAAKQAKKELGL